MSENKTNSSGSSIKLTGIEMFWVKLSKDNPSPAFGDSGPKWEFQARTTNPKQRKEWVEAGLNVKAVNDEESGTLLYWKTMFRKPTTKRDGTDQAPVKVINGSLKEIDPSIIGNGSICNVRVFQHPYEVKSAKPGGPTKKGISSMLMAVQVTKLVKYVPREREDDFELTETEIVEPKDNQEYDEETFVEDNGNGDALDQADGQATPDVTAKPVVAAADPEF